MKKNYVFYAVLVILFLKDCSACFQKDQENSNIVTTGSTFYEECCCEEPGYTVKNLQWRDPHDRVIVGPGTDSKVFTEEQTNCLSLHIPVSTKNLAGQYRCVTKFENKQYKEVYNLDVYDPVYFYETRNNQNLVLNNNSQITCKAKGASTPLMRWYKGKDGQTEIFNDTAKYEITHEGLLIKNVNSEDEGTYKCSASVLSTGEEVEIYIEAKVMTPPLITQMVASPEAKLASGETLMIQCLAEGWPEPKREFKKVGDSNPAGNKTVNWIQSNDTIRFKNIKPEDAGTYECTAFNDAGISKKQLNIVVLTRPEIIGFSNKSAVEGAMLPIICNATGLPPPKVTITYEGRSLDEERYTDYEEEIINFSTLHVNRSSEGIYICNATNIVDTTTELMYLAVLHQPYFDNTYELVWAWNGETVNISCEQESNPPANFSWNYIKDDYATVKSQALVNIIPDYETELEHSFTFSNEFAPFGKHECWAKNEYGEANKVYYIRKGFTPSIVENASSIDETATSASFHIEPPTNYDGPNVIGFIAEYDQADNYDITNIHPNRTWATGIPFKLDKLRPNTTYYIKFAAINRVGTGEWSGLMSFNTMDKSAPEPPIWQVDALELSSSKVLKWKAPENNGEPIDFYVLRYCPMDEELDESLCKEHKLKETTELEVPDLQYNTTYYLELIAHNARGNSAPANMSLTVPGEILSAPSSLLSAGAVIGISIVVVLVCLVLLDVLLYLWKKQGIIASCCCKKSKKRKPNPLNARDKKGLLKDNGKSGTDDTLKRPDNGHKEYEYNKTTGIITGKHSSV
ncbi:hypothetical protein PYW08_011879 [Mythimna loreyi]|uniref:Uncharacterized protein n=1 Tax=Mythimna loreyi TaxID=667449 RepID=A0ACC2QKN2_9NEOP|nr:hypothetical protein PYW08_011879 [Mythimna loreyi]